ncbi:hypothetical protein SmJEL517_g02241 [Synchytrium microbalum]|uniref:Uncharacterized protein n=1 Tax=Synchytrium microbalum TaxID=1806994 RepID=A0A507C2I4_9FUNG|nr:uncharacterized protein SmJEL517_g02241 [Synchytrium microbalum]TPX35337.1 hypothetical protein SmJEL517_g02241 [Synchytrium microbalum]
MAAGATAFSPELRARSVALYRGLLRISRAWPKQERRRIKSDEAIIKGIKTGFASKPKSESLLATAVKDGEMQLTALRNILNNKIEHQFPLDETSRIKSFLPSSKSFSLLDSESQKELDRKEEGSFTFLKSYMSGKRERGMHDK